MSGPVANNVFRSSGVIASAAGGLSWQDVVTASTVTVSAGMVIQSIPHLILVQLHYPVQQKQAIKLYLLTMHEPGELIKL